MNRYDFILQEVKVARKPSDMSDVPKNYFSKLSSKIQNLIKELPIEDGNHLDFSDGGEGFFTDWLNGNQQFYIVKIQDRIFFVDTQGYDYAKYVGELDKIEP